MTRPDSAPLPMLAIPRRLRHSIAIGILLLLPALTILAPNIVTGRTLVPYDVLAEDPVFEAPLLAAGGSSPDNALLADLVFQNDVWKRYAVDSLQAGDVPLWNRLVFAGQPFWATGQHSLLYPSTLLFLILPIEQAFTWNALIACWLAGITAYALGRALRLRPLPSLVMGTAWSVNLIMVANVVFPMIQGVLVWTPLLLAGVEVTCRTAAESTARSALPRGRAVPWLLALSLSTAFAALSGHVEMLYYAGLLTVAFALFRLLGLGGTAGWPVAGRVAGWLAASAGLGLALAAVQLVPMAELARVNWRSGSETYETVRGYAFGWRQALTFVVPDAYGNPAHHDLLDLSSGRRIAVADTTMWGSAWGTKNYVEAAAYVGILPLLLALVGLLHARRKGLALFLGAAAAASLSFAFGLPTYRLLFLALPGFDQLHTPFRWVFPFALCTVMLAGLGADRLLDRDAPRWLGGLGAVVAGSGMAMAAALWVLLLAPRTWTRLFERALSGAEAAREAVLGTFGQEEAFASYQFWNLAHLAVFLALAGLAVAFLARAARTAGQRRRRTLFVVAVVGADLAAIGCGFNPAVDARFAQVHSPALDWLVDAAATKWGRVVGFGQAKVLWPNSAMRGPVCDIRGYDSTIPSWFVETFNAIDTGNPSLEAGEERHGMLAYNRIGNLTRPESLSHPALAAMGARYVVTTETPESADLTLVHQTDRVRVYENAAAMPRAWVVNRVEVVADRPQLLTALAVFDPSTTVLLEEVPDAGLWRDLGTGRAVGRSTTRVRQDAESANSLEVEVAGAPSGGMLVVSDTWYPGWRAKVQPAGVSSPIEVPVLRANGSMRAIPVPPGLSTVRLVFSPMSVKVGLYGSFLAAVVLLLLAAYAVWDRLVGSAQMDGARRVAVNSVGPMAASLLNKAIDFAFAMLMLRVLGSEGAGSYYYAVAVIGFAEIFTNFGLNLFTTREVARRRERAGEVLASTSMLRIVLWFLAIPLMAGYLSLERSTGSPVDRETTLALVLLAISLLPAGLNTALSSVFQGLERMVLPAVVTIVATLVKVSLGAMALLAGLGFVGLAAVSIVTNLITFALLATLMRRAGVRLQSPAATLSLGGIVRDSWPLMINHLLVTLFFRIDVLLLRRLQGAVVVGWYSTAYKWVDALLIIPPAVTMALFPLLSRHAGRDEPALRRTYVMALRWLITLALPIAALTTFSAEWLVRVLGGSEYLPHGAIALRIMIWFLPFSFANGLTQYVLIALDRQRWITVSFVIAATFNVVANLLVIPRYSYSGAAAVTIASEIVLMVPFLWGLRDLGAPPLLVLAWRPALATSLMAISMAALDSVGAPFAAVVAAGSALFALALWPLGAVTREDRALLARLAHPRVAPADPAVDPDPCG